MIQVKNLTKIYKRSLKKGNVFQKLFSASYEEKKAVDDVSFEIGENELVGFIGPNGAGKTTTMKILSGILYPTHGKISVLGYTPFEKQSEFLKQIAFVMGQKNQLLWELPATDSFILNKEVYEVKDAEYKKTIDELTSLLKVQDLLEQPIKTLSLGQRMRMELIASLIHKPKILFLDEPTIGLDIFAQTVIRDFIREYQERHNATIILTSHYMQDVQELANRVIVINNGSVLFDGKLSTLIDKFSQEKTISITLTKPVSQTFVDKHKAQYEYPRLTIEMRKKELDTALPKILQEVEYSDLTISDEPIEEIVKKVFRP